MFLREFNRVGAMFLGGRTADKFVVVEFRYGTDHETLDTAGAVGLQDDPALTCRQEAHRILGAFFSRFKNNDVTRFAGWLDR